VGDTAAATVSHQVNGIVLCIEMVSLDVWSTRLSRELLRRAATASLAQLLTPRSLD
jgi:hypothetical protein